MSGLAAHGHLTGYTPALLIQTSLNEPQLPRIRSTARRTRSQDPGAAPRQPRTGFQYRGRDRQAAGQAEDAHGGNLPQPDAMAGGPACATSGAAVHPRLHQGHVRGVPRAGRRPCLCRGCRHCRRPCPHQWPRRGHHRPSERPRHQDQDPPQFRHAAPGRLSQGLAPDETGRALQAAAADLHRHPWRLSWRRCRRARPVGGHCPQPDRDGRAEGADPLHRDWRGRLGWRAGHRRRRPHQHAAVFDLLGDLAGRLCLDSLEDRRESQGCRRRTRHHRQPPARTRPRRQGRPRAARRCPPQSASNGGAPQGRPPQPA